MFLARREQGTVQCKHIQGCRHHWPQVKEGGKGGKMCTLSKGGKGGGRKSLDFLLRCKGKFGESILVSQSENLMFSTETCLMPEMLKASISSL